MHGEQPHSPTARPRPLPFLPSTDLDCPAGVLQIYRTDTAREALHAHPHPNSQLATIDPITRLDLAQDARPPRQVPPSRLESTTDHPHSAPTPSTPRQPRLQTLSPLVPATRRALVEDSDGDPPPAAPSGARPSRTNSAPSHRHTLADPPRPHKRQRIATQTTSTTSTTSLATIHRTPHAQTTSTDNMYIPRSDKMPSSASINLNSEAGPSSITLDKASRSNGITAINGFKPNGSSPVSNGLANHGASVARVSLPGTTLYEDPYVDREEFVRLVIQSLRDVGYM